MTNAPAARPANARFSSGPCAKRPGWTPQNPQGRAARPLAPLQARQGAAEARHRPDARGAAGSRRLPHRHRARLRHRRLRDGDVVDARRARRRRCWPGKASAKAGSPTRQAAEARRRRVHHAPTTAQLPDLDAGRLVDTTCVFTWNGTTSGVRVPNGDWIPADREGPDHLRRDHRRLRPGRSTGTSSMSSTFSWQKVLGGEGGARRADPRRPRAVERLESYTPAWPLPKIFRMTKGGKLTEGIFKGETINTPVDARASRTIIDALEWAQVDRRPRRR